MIFGLGMCAERKRRGASGSDFLGKAIAGLRLENGV